MEAVLMKGVYLEAVRHQREIASTDASLTGWGNVVPQKHRGYLVPWCEMRTHQQYRIEDSLTGPKILTSQYWTMVQLLGLNNVLAENVYALESGICKQKWGYRSGSTVSRLGGLFC